MMPGYNKVIKMFTCEEISFITLHVLIVGVHDAAHVWRTKDNFCTQFILCPYCVGPGLLIQVTSLGGKCLYRLSSLATPRLPVFVMKL